MGREVRRLLRRWYLRPSLDVPIGSFRSRRHPAPGRGDALLPSGRVGALVRSRSATRPVRPDGGKGPYSHWADSMVVNLGRPPLFVARPTHSVGLGEVRNGPHIGPADWASPLIVRKAGFNDGSVGPRW